MKLRYLGYPCTNVTLSATTGRTVRLANLTDEKAEAVARENLTTLTKMLEWNLTQGVHFLRIGSSIIPLASHKAFPFNWRGRFESELAHIRDFTRQHHMRLSMHPGQYTVLNSPKETVVEASVRELEYHAAFLEAVDPGSGTMTLHAGGAYGDKITALNRLKENINLLSPLARGKLTLENDDRTFHTEDVLGVCEQMGLPVIFDFFHHKLNPVHEKWDEELVELVERVVGTWSGRIPKFHLSSPRDFTTAHADFVELGDFLQVTDTLDQIGGDEPYDVMLEAKQKDVALLRLLEEVRSSVSSEEESIKALRGSVLKYDDPLEPVGVEDWEALK